MNAQFQVVRKVEFFDGIFNYQDIFFKFAGKFCSISHIINSLVKPAGEFWGDGLYRNAQVRNHFKDEKEFDRRLWRLHFVHGYLGYEICRPLAVCYKTIDISCFVDSRQKFVCDLFEKLVVNFECMGNLWNRKMTGIGPAGGNKRFNLLVGRRNANLSCNINGEEIGGVNEVFDISQVNMVGVDTITSFVAQRVNGLVSFFPGIIRVSVDVTVFAVRFVPYRGYFNTCRMGL